MKTLAAAAFLFFAVLSGVTEVATAQPQGREWKKATVPGQKTPEQGLSELPQIKKLKTQMEELAVRIEDRDGKKTRVQHMYVASITLPGESCFVVFEQEDGKKGKTFGLFFVLQEGSWTGLQEDFYDAPL